MVLGSDVPLEEDILIEKKPFSPTFQEWAADGNVEQVIIFNNKVNATEETIHTVGAAETLFITSMQMSLSYLGDPGGERALIKINSGASGREILVLQANDGVGVSDFGNANTSITFNMPLKVSSGSLIRHDNPTNGQSTIIIIGFVLPHKISIR